MTTWVLERDVFADGDDALARAVNESGGRVIAWQDDWWLIGRWPVVGDRVVFHGSLSNADRVARDLEWRPGSYCATSRFACSAWWPQVPELLVSKVFWFTTAADLAANGAPGDLGERIFVRPDSALKPFSGRVLESDRITLAALDHGYYYEDPALPVVVTPVVDIRSEWRFVVANGQVIAGGAYAADGRTAGEMLTPDDESWNYARRVMENLESPEPVFVLDICQTDQGLRLLELNPFSGADLYNCDRHAVVSAVDGLAVA